MLSGLCKRLSDCFRKPSNFLAIQQALLSMAITKEEPQEKKPVTLKKVEEVKIQQEEDEKEEVETVSNAATRIPKLEISGCHSNRPGSHFPEADPENLLPSLRSMKQRRGCQQYMKEDNCYHPPSPLRATVSNQSTVPATEEQCMLAHPIPSPRISAGF